MSHPSFSRKRRDSPLALHSLVIRHGGVCPESREQIYRGIRLANETREMHFAASGNSTRLSIIERPGNMRPNWPMKAGNSQAEWLGIGVTLNTGKSHIAHGSNYGVTVTITLPFVLFHLPF